VAVAKAARSGGKKDYCGGELALCLGSGLRIIDNCMFSASYACNKSAHNIQLSIMRRYGA
jgi:hypothetical protein